MLREKKPGEACFILYGSEMPLWNLVGYVVSRWESQGMTQIPGLFPLNHGCLSRCTRSGNHKVRKRIRHSDQEAPLSAAESKEDPHPWTGLVVCKRPTESKSPGWAVRDTLSVSLGAPTWFSWGRAIGSCDVLTSVQWCSQQLSNHPGKKDLDHSFPPWPVPPKTK